MKQTAESIVQRLQEAGYEALFAGGCVRDALLGNEPKDYDIATDATPDEILRLFPKGDTIGAHFGVILVKENGFHFEIATFREDGNYLDGRRPEDVRFSDSKSDAQRRDFTINGMFHDPVSGETIDYVGGKKDLDARLIRAIGDPLERFEEDYLRVLRAIRFATVLDFAIEPETWKAIRKVAPQLKQISVERIQHELDKIWLSPHRVKGFDLLVDSGLMAELIPEILDLQGCEQPPQWHPEGDVFVHTRLMLGMLEPNASLPLVLSVLFHDIGKPATYSYDPAEDRIRFNKHDKVGARMTEEILKRFRYPNSVIEAAVTGVERHMQFANVQKMKVSKLKRFMDSETFDDEMELHRVDCGSSHRKFDNYHFLKEKIEEFANEPLIPPRLLTGHDLIERGWQPGPAMGKILTKAQDLQLEGRLTTREEALEWLASAIEKEDALS